jgi:hypothetical protein
MDVCGHRMTWVGPEGCEWAQKDRSGHRRIGVCTVLWE